MWQATANYRDLWLQLPSRIERHAKLRSFHIRRTWCSLQRLSDLLNADFLLCLWIDSNASFPRLTAASTRFGSAVQTKGFWGGVGLSKEAIDSDLEINEGAEDAALEAAPCELGEGAFHGVIFPQKNGQG